MNHPKEKDRLSVIESLSKGFQIVSRHWWLILIPILLDAFLWLGPQASIQNIVTETMETLDAELADMPTQDMGEWFLTLRDALQEAAARYNTFSMLRVAMLGVPSLIIWGGAYLSSPSIYESLWVSFLRVTEMPDLLVSVSEAEFRNAPVWQVPSQGSWLLVSIGLTLVGVTIGCIYMTVMAQSLNSATESWAFWPRAWRLGRRFVLYWILRALVLLILGIPFGLTFALLMALNTGLALLFTSIAMGMATWLSFYGSFVIAAMVVNDAGVWRAILNSVNVVLRNFWSTLWLFVLINLIGGGLTLLWQQLSRGSWWTWIAIVGNAYISTSLIAASLLFYQDRYTSWQRALTELLAKQSKRMA
jgi:hypothetical protein